MYVGIIELYGHVEWPVLILFMRQKNVLRENNQNCNRLFICVFSIENYLFMTFSFMD